MPNEQLNKILNLEELTESYINEISPYLILNNYLLFENSFIELKNNKNSSMNFGI
ncbi:MAG: hypothetical protein HYX60_12260 [Legionella longbeachae]|nr:hypothetical protein [Legionella longbeachae]